MAATRVLARRAPTVTEVSVPEHLQMRAAQEALGEGPLSLFKTGFFGAFTRTYYPASLIAAINQMWASHADVLAPRTKMGLIGAELARRKYHGRVYAKGQNVRRPSSRRSTRRSRMSTCWSCRPASSLRPRTTPRAATWRPSRTTSRDHRGALPNTQPFNYTGHPALAVPVGKSSAGLPASMQLIGRFFDDPLLLRVAYAYRALGRLGRPQRRLAVVLDTSAAGGRR